MIDDARRQHLRPIGFQPGQSGNPAGRPVGSRQKVAEAFIRDYGAAWDRHGVEALDKLALTDPGKFCTLAASLLPRDVALTLETRLPGGLSSEAWTTVMEILAAVQSAIPDASEREPGEVLNLDRKSTRL